jgi:hypothetical protein
LTVEFEDVLENLSSEILRLGDFCGVAVEESDAPSSPPTSKQSSSEKKRWMDRFKEETPSMPHFDVVSSRKKDTSYQSHLRDWLFG